MSRFLVVTWDGAGNLVPTLGIARQLSREGHDVRLLGHQGVPMRCVPLGRDQFFNASRVEALGAGRVLGSDADEHAIAGAVRSLLVDDMPRASARRFADVIACYQGGAGATRDLERLADPRRTV